VLKVTIGSSKKQDKTSCHVIVEANVPSCLGWTPEEEIYTPPVADPSEITVRPNVRKAVQSLEMKEIKKGTLSKTNSAKGFSATFRFASLNTQRFGEAANVEYLDSSLAQLAGALLHTFD
jgi:hypothetical protein